MSIGVAIIGASGYTGGELIRLLDNHPEADIIGVYGERSAGKSIKKLHPNLRGFEGKKVKKPDYSEIGENADLVFTATPHGVAMKVVPKVLEGGSKVIDLSADYRLEDVEIYERYYTKHETPYIKAVYGLPEFYRDEIKGADLIANPGCYPTAALLSLAPLIRENLIKLDPIVIDAKSGTSGAGAKPSERLHHPTCAENLQAYNPTNHRHTPEISQEIEKLAGKKAEVHFTPHLVPIVRGILSTSHVFLTEPQSEGDVLKLYRKFYRDEIFVRICGDLPQVSSVIGSNFCDIGISLDKEGERLVVVSVLDNLIKGASGQSVQNMNLMFWYKESEGLGAVALGP